ncbi:MAG: exodeoxyribonuclease V subunit gamma [Thermodesulfobacteriota bacterium]
MNHAILLHRSNRIESLLEALAEVVATPLPSPLSAECVVVQSRGMASWLAMRLAERFGVWANPDFPRPRQFVQRLLRATLGEEGDLVRRSDREHLSLLLLELLDLHGDQPVFAPLAASLRQQAPGARLRLARHIADLFDQYAVYRPEMVLAWEEGGNQTPGGTPDQDGWQPVLWRAVAARLGCDSSARLMIRAGQALAEGRVPLGGLLPERVCLFGINTLPPLYLQLFSALARNVPVHLFLFAPSAEYVADLLPRQEIERRLARAPVGLTAEELSLEVGHPLLASLGRVGRDFQQLLENEPVMEAGEHFFEHAPPDSALQLLQNDILLLQHRGPFGDGEPWPLPPQDDSIAVHACHSRLREVEVLQDRLLGLLNDDPTLAPRDILVMMPDVGAYAPLIEGVFGLSPEEGRFLPFRIADRPLAGQVALVEAFARLLRLSGARMTAPAVMELLSCPEVRARFGLAEDELPELRRWVRESGIRWGVDETHRRELAMPEDRHNTWRFGFDRLILGAAMRSDGQPVGEIYPWQGIPGGDACLAGRFIHFCETVFQQVGALAQPRTLPQWRRQLTGLLQALFAEDGERGWQAQLIRDSLAVLEEEGAELRFDGELDLAGLQALLMERLETSAGGRGFLEGGITFCGMLPMRSIPFRVICLLGMNDGDFPRQSHARAFDLITRQPRTGDRESRHDDRYLFLEALLAARERLLIFYQGASQRDGKPMPPSVVVDELLDCLAETLALPDAAEDAEERGKQLRARLVTRHPLQPFSCRYFDGSDPRLFSFSDHCARAAAKRATGMRADHRLLPEPLPSAVAAEGVATLSLAELARFLASPVRWFVEQRLRIVLREGEHELDERELIEADALTLHQLSGELLEVCRADADVSALFAQWQGEGRLPLGQAALPLLTRIEERVLPLAEKAGRYAPSQALPARIAVARLDQGRLVEGRLGDRYAEGQVRCTVSRLHGKVLLDAWLRHLLLCADAPGDQACRTVVIGQGDKHGAVSIAFAPVEAPLALLADLLALHEAGSTEPLLFFPKTSFAYADAIKRGRDEEQALAAAGRQYRGHGFSGAPPGEGENPYLRLLLGEDDPLAPGYSPYRVQALRHSFAELALRVYSPMLDHMEEG